MNRQDLLKNLGFAAAELRAGISTADAASAVILLGRLIPFFPTDASTRELLADCLREFVGSPNELKWLVTLAVNVMPEWKGLAELRGLYCTRYRPLDQIEAVSGTAGFTPGELANRAERDYFEREHRHTAQRLQEYRREFARLPQAEQAANQQVLIKAASAELKRLR